MATNNKTSILVSEQLPDFIRSDHQTFVSFLEAYYEYLEQSNSTLQFGKTIERAKNIRNYFDTDKITESGLEEFNSYLYDQFIQLLPKNISADRSKLLKNIKSFYASRGTEKSYNFLFNILFRETPEFYYPKNDILIASSGKWIIEKSVRLTDIKINGVSDDSISSLIKFKNTKLLGNTSLNEAQIERVVISYDLGIKYNEFFISKPTGDYVSGESVFATNVDNETLSANLISGFINSISINSPGSGYVVGTSIPIVGGGGNGGSAIISSVSPGNVATLSVINGGAGFRVDDFILFTSSSGDGTVNANVISVSANNFHHPNTININSDVIDTYNAITIGSYSNGFSGNANTTLGSTLTFFALSNLGPIASVGIIVGGNNYTTIPSASGLANTRLKDLGIVGRLNILSAGSGYANNAKLIFTNPVGSYGFGANGNVITNASGSIIRTTLTPWANGHIIGGIGYNMSLLPTVSIEGSGSGANINVAALMGFGDVLSANSGSLGAIQQITITNRGTGYTSPPTLVLNGLSSGFGANATANISAGSFAYPGRFKDDTGLLSSSNYLQDRDFYQNFSYVIKLKRSLSDYKKYAQKLIHPSGFKMWGEYLYEANPDVNTSVSVENTIVSKINSQIYTANVITFGADSTKASRNWLSGISGGLSANTKTMTNSFWIKLNTYPDNRRMTIFSYHTNTVANNSPDLSTTRYTIYGTQGNNGTDVILNFRGRGVVSGNIVFEMSSNSGMIYANNWYHVLSTIDTANISNCRIYINNLPSQNVKTILNESMITSNTGVSSLGSGWIGAVDVSGSTRFQASLSEFWLSNTCLDIANSTIRAAFNSANGTLSPSYLGPNGNLTVFDTTPTIYLKNISNSNPSSVNFLSVGSRSVFVFNDTGSLANAFVATPLTFPL